MNPMKDYKAPLRDMHFVLHEVLGLEEHYKALGLDIDKDFINAVLEEGARFTENELAPINRSGDEEGVQFCDGQVTTPTGFREAYRKYCEGGWPAFTADEMYGGQGLPDSLATPFHEMTMSANLAWRIYTGLTEGAILALEQHASQEIKDRYMPKMVSGEWTGTMCLTEPHAGTDLGLLSTRAVPEPGGSYSVTGTKIFISGGENDLADNIIHLVLARLPDAPAGSKGISLFVVPKYIPESDGSPGKRNNVHCGAVEHKMGIKASATCVMNFDNAQGWLVGEMNRGLAGMFTMMNDARFQVGLQGNAIGEMAFQGALKYARERLQGRSASGAVSKEQAADSIIVHPDVRRMLLTQKALVEGGRAFSYFISTLLDQVHFTSDPIRKQEHNKLLALLIPVMKSFLTDAGQEVSSLGVQCYGGHGFIREWGMEQLMRDSRITMLYEGTNGIQALDFIGRKVLADQGSVLTGFIRHAEAFCAQYQNPLSDRLASQLSEWKQVADYVINHASETDYAGSASVDFLNYSAYTILGYFWLTMAASAETGIKENPDDKDFYTSKIKTAQFYFDRLLPRTQMHKAALMSGPENLMSLDEAHFSF